MSLIYKNKLKTVSISLSIVIFSFLAVLFLMPASKTAYADPGPNTSESSAAYVQLGNRTDGYKVLYSATKTTTVDKMAGASYDLATNTLTLNNFNKPEYVVTANEMGDDFKISLTGDNHVQYISIWGYGYGGSLELTGTGSLTLNENKKTEYDVIRLLAEASASKLTIGQYVTLKATLPAEDSIIGVYDTTLSTDALVMDNATATSTYKVEPKDNKTTKSVSAYISTVTKDYEKVTNSNDPSGQYGLIRYEKSSSGRLFEVYKMTEVPDVGLIGVLDETLSGQTLNPALKAATDGADDADVSLNKSKYYYSAIDTTSLNLKILDVYEKDGKQYSVDHYTILGQDQKTSVDVYNFYTIRDINFRGIILADPVAGMQNLSKMPDGYNPIDGPIYHSFIIKSASVSIKGATPPKAKKVPFIIGTTFKNKSSKGYYIVCETGKAVYVKPSTKKITDVVIPKKVKGQDGYNYKVVGIRKKAFYGYKKLKSITIQTTYLKSKKMSKYAFKGVKKKVKVIGPKAKKKNYKTLFVSKGLSKKIKVRWQ